MKKKVWERIIPLRKADRSWDIKFWQSQGADARFKAAWGLLEVLYKIRGEKINASTFRLQKSVENIKQVKANIAVPISRHCEAERM